MHISTCAGFELDCRGPAIPRNLTNVITSSASALLEDKKTDPYTRLRAMLESAILRIRLTSY